jgi:alginate O-acetyltransferase complex protein AlgJ
MADSLQRGSKNLGKYIYTGIALATGAVVTLDGMIRFWFLSNNKDFWNYPWLILIIIFLASTVIAAWVFEKIIRIFMEQVKNRNGFRLYIWLLFLYALFLVMLFLFRLPNPLTPLFSFWSQGKKAAVLKVSDIFIHFVVIPCILFDLTVGRYVKIKNSPLGWFESIIIPLNYDRLFISVLVAAGLSWFFMSPGIDIRNPSNNIRGISWFKDVYAVARLTLGDRFYDVTIAQKGNWFVYNGELSSDDYQNTIPFTPQDLIDIQGKLDQLYDFLTFKGIRLVVVVPPNKNTIYPQYMPPQIPIIGSQSRLDQLIAYENDHGKVKVIDLRSNLLKASNEHQTYYSCGTHWDGFGAFVAYQDIMISLEKYYPNLKAHELNEYRYINNPGDTFLGDLVHIDHSICSGIDLEPLYNHQLITEQSWNAVHDTAWNYFNPAAPVKYTDVNLDPSLPRLLMYMDSFGPYLRPLLSDHFSQAFYLWAYPTDALYFDIAIEKPDVVIIEFTERYLFFLKMILASRN